MEDYLYEDMRKKYDNLEYVSLDLMEGEQAYDSYDKMSAHLRFVGVASFDGHGTEPSEMELNEEQGFLLTGPNNKDNVQKAIDQNPMLKDVIVEQVSFTALDACDPFPKDCKGEIIKEDKSATALVSTLAVVSLLVVVAATFILRRKIQQSARDVALSEAQASKEAVNSETSVSVPDQEVTPGCASLVGSAAVSLGLDNKEKEGTSSLAIDIPPSPGTPYSRDRPQEIQVLSGESEDEMDLGYLTMDEDLQSQYFDPTKHAFDEATLASRDDDTGGDDDGNESVSP